MMVAGCGRIGFDVIPGDGGLEFSAPTAISELDGPKDERDPSLTADMLEIFFTVMSSANNDADIWHATRATAADPFGAPALVTELYTPEFEDTPEISPDGLTIFFSRGGSGALIYVATRSTRADAWSTPVLVPELGTSAAVRPGSLINNALKLYLSEGPTGFTEILVSTRASALTPWSTPVPVAELSSPESDSDPAVDPSDSVIYFSRFNNGLLDLVRAVRPAPGAPFAPVQFMDELNSAADDTDPWISPQRDVLVFSSGRDGTRRLYMVTARQ